MMPFPPVFPFFGVSRPQNPTGAVATVAMYGMLGGSFGRMPSEYPATVVETDDELPWWNIVLEQE